MSVRPLMVPLNELEAFGLVVRKASLKEDRVHPELRVEQWHVTVHFDEKVDALVALVEMRVVVRQCLRTAGTAERPTRRHLIRETERVCFIKDLKIRLKDLYICCLIIPIIHV